MAWACMPFIAFVLVLLMIRRATRSIAISHLLSLDGNGKKNTCPSNLEVCSAILRSIFSCWNLRLNQ